MKTSIKARTARAATQGRNKIQEDRALLRREYVARFRIAGMTYREIAVELSKLTPPILNDETGKPYHYSQIKRDMDVITKEWKSNAQESVSIHIAQQLADIREGKRLALSKFDLPSFARFIGLEMQLLGTDAPQKHEDWTDRSWREYAEENGLSETDIIAEAERIASDYSRANVSPAGSDRSSGGTETQAALDGDR